MLKIRNLNVYYGNIHAIHDVSIDVKAGDVVSLIGANGAGKTTIMHTIAGLKKPQSGEILLNDKNIVGLEPNKILTMKMAQVPEGRRIFAQMTVEENLDMGAFIRKDKKGIAEDIEYIYAKFPRLKERRKQLAGTLSGGEQQMLAIGRALMSKPEILLLDEPSMGLSPILVKEVFNVIRDVNDLGTTILLVEQNAKMALSISDKAYVLETGKIVMEGVAADLMQDDRVKKAYLGV
ncbi:MAG: ABC transporter ATP-binding protein [Oscillospiraceae bacterium]|nr:ABC transporter ATP-binding protein [Oscillospiraceae bacterium]